MPQRSSAVLFHGRLGGGTVHHIALSTSAVSPNAATLASFTRTGTRTCQEGTHGTETNIS